MYHIQELVELGFVRIDIRNIYIKDHDSWHCIELFCLSGGRGQLVCFGQRYQIFTDKEVGIKEAAIKTPRAL